MYTIYMVYFYNEKPPLSEIFYFILGLVWDFGKVAK